MKKSKNTTCLRQSGLPLKFFELIFISRLAVVNSLLQPDGMQGRAELQLCMNMHWQSPLIYQLPVLNHVPHKNALEKLKQFSIILTKPILLNQVSNSTNQLLLHCHKVNYYLKDKSCQEAKKIS